MTVTRSAADAPPRWRIALLRGVVRLLFAALTRVEVHGRERIPANGGAVLIFNHLSNLDPPLFFALIERPKLTALLAADYRERPFHRLCIEAAGGLWLRRGAGDRAALTAATARLTGGWMVGIAPEGRRSRTHAMNEAKPGAAYLASVTGALVFPAGISGTERITRDLRRLRRPRVTVTFGEPFTFPPLEPGCHKQQLAARTTLMMESVAALVPPSYRGFYAHPPVPEATGDSPG